jgi:hypothetical protein
MPRNMSFAMTTEQARNKTKDVTRRLGWWFLKPGDIVQQVEKGMGLGKGGKVVRLHLIEIVSVRREPLQRLVDKPYRYGNEEARREGFPEMSGWEFVQHFLRNHPGKDASLEVNRIEFKYI